ncbi:hypothetical protein [Weissella cibaria]|uniref:hypothetical protein n=1 Tax=Weissella cibaria TaxID=137591 RepID=UPI0036D88E4F
MTIFEMGLMKMYVIEYYGGYVGNAVNGQIQTTFSPFTAKQFWSEIDAQNFMYQHGIAFMGKIVRM